MRAIASTRLPKRHGSCRCFSHIECVRANGYSAPSCIQRAKSSGRAPAVEAADVGAAERHARNREPEQHAQRERELRPAARACRRSTAPHSAGCRRARSARAGTGADRGRARAAPRASRGIRDGRTRCAPSRAAPCASDRRDRLAHVGEILRLQGARSAGPARTSRFQPAGSFMSFQMPATPASSSGACCAPHHARTSGRPKSGSAASFGHTRSENGEPSSRRRKTSCSRPSRYTPSVRPPSRPDRRSARCGSRLRAARAPDPSDPGSGADAR